MKVKVTTTYLGNCPRCNMPQEDSEQSHVDIDCWECSVNASMELHDIIRDIKSAIIPSDAANENTGLKRALEIVRKYDH